MNTPFTTPPSIMAQINQLPQLPITELRELWQQLYGKPTQMRNRTFLQKRIAYKLQENAFRQVNPQLLERNQQRISELMALQQQTTGDDTLLPGTVLVREYQGVEHKVTVLSDGQFEYQKCSYSSLSKIAREITGTRWSGPVFFGVPSKQKRGGKS